MTQTAEILEALPPVQMQPTGLAQFDLAVTATPLVINWNRDAVSALLDATLEQYEKLVVQEEDVPAIKSEMAGLNKLRDRLDNARKEITRQIAGPLEAFDAEAKALVARVVEVREGLNRQVKEFERRDREGRRQSVQFVIDALKTSEGVPELDIPIKEPWLNKSIKQAQLHAEIQNIILKHKQDKAAAEQLERARADRATMVEAALKAKAEEYGFSLPMGKFAPCPVAGHYQRRSRGRHRAGLRGGGQPGASSQQRTRPRAKPQQRKPGRPGQAVPDATARSPLHRRGRLPHGSPGHDDPDPVRRLRTGPRTGRAGTPRATPFRGHRHRHVTGAHLPRRPHRARRGACTPAKDFS